MKKLFGTTVMALSLLLAGCAGSAGEGKFEGIKDYTDSVNYAIGVQAAGNLLRDSLVLRDDLLKQGLSDGMNGNVEKAPTLANRSDSMCYMVGKSISKALMEMKYELRDDCILAGFKDKGANKPLVDPEKCNSIINAFVNAQRQKNPNPNQPPAADPKIAMANMATGQAFLAENKSAAGITTTPSGLQYKVVKKGKGGAKATINDKVKCHYRGTLLDGTQFDSSYDRGEPATFPLNGVIRGWQEGIPFMAVGDKFEFWIPSEIAYGENGPPNIGPNQVLKFEVELIEINPK